MKITDQRIRQIIKEEVQRALSEQRTSAEEKKKAADRASQRWDQEWKSSPMGGEARELGDIERSAQQIQGAIQAAQDAAKKAKKQGKDPCDDPEFRKLDSTLPEFFQFCDPVKPGATSKKKSRYRMHRKGLRRLKRIYPLLADEALYDKFYSDLAAAGIRIKEDSLWGRQHARALRKLKRSGKMHTAPADWGGEKDRDVGGEKDPGHGLPGAIGPAKGDKAQEEEATEDAEEVLRKALKTY